MDQYRRLTIQGDDTKGDTMNNLLPNEPVMKWAALLPIGVALWAFLESMGWVHMTAAQDAKLAALAALIIPFVTGAFARSKVSPVK
jgi:hypothetical protein